MKTLHITYTSHNQVESIPLVGESGNLQLADAAYHACDVLGGERCQMLVEEILAQVNDGDTRGEQSMFDLPLTWEVTTSEANQ